MPLEMMCGCSVKRGHPISFCLMHAAAPEMQRALRILRLHLEKQGDVAHAWLELIDDALPYVPPVDP